MFKQKKLAAIDVDGVLADFEGEFCKQFGWENRNLVGLEERYPKEHYEIESFVKASSTYERLDILHLGVQITKFLAEKDFDIHIVSSRPEYCTQITGLWLRRNKIPFHFLSVGIKEKIGYYVNLRPDLVVEDIREIAIGTARFGIRSFLIDQPWNFSLATNGVLRIHTFSKFLRAFDEIQETLMGF